MHPYCLAEKYCFESMPRLRVLKDSHHNSGNAHAL